jgi:hypothetical protein
MRGWLIDGFSSEFLKRRGTMPDPVKSLMGRACTLKCTPEHVYVKQLVNAAAERRRLTRKELAELIEWVDGTRLMIDLSYNKRGFDAVIDIADASSLPWFVGLGCAALFDQLDGPYQGVVCYCENFSGERHDTKYCGRYVLMISDGGRKPSAYCSAECRNRVNQRKTARRQRQRDREAAAPFRDVRLRVTPV